MLGLPPLVAETPQHPLITAFAEQFAVDVTGIDELMRAELAEAAGDRMFPVVLAIYLGDWVPRVRHALDALFAPSDWPAPVPRRTVSAGPPSTSSSWWSPASTASTR